MGRAKQSSFEVCDIRAGGHHGALYAGGLVGLGGCRGVVAAAREDTVPRGECPAAWGWHGMERAARRARSAMALSNRPPAAASGAVVGASVAPPIC
jgi:hypothetical protein